MMISRLVVGALVASGISAAICVHGSLRRQSIDPPTAQERRWWDANRPSDVAGTPPEIAEDEMGRGLTYTLLTAVASGDIEIREGGSHIVITDGPEAAAWNQCLRVSAGWPYPAFEGSYWVTDVPADFDEHMMGGVTPMPDDGRTVGSIRVGWMERQGTPRLIPLVPLWRGLIANMVFFAVVLVVCEFGYRHARALFRDRRGLCRKCGYDLRESVADACPECGAPIESR